jgi:hypothetical protein
MRYRAGITAASIRRPGPYGAQHLIGSAKTIGTLMNIGSTCKVRYSISYSVAIAPNGV